MAFTSMSCLLPNLLTTDNRARQGLLQLIYYLSLFNFILPLFLGMIMYAYEFKTKEKLKLAEIEINCNKYNGLYQRTQLIRSRLSASMQHKLLLSRLLAVFLVSVPFFQGNVEGCLPGRRHCKQLILRTHYFYIIVMQAVCSKTTPFFATHVRCPSP